MRGWCSERAAGGVGNRQAGRYRGTKPPPFERRDSRQHIHNVPSHVGRRSRNRTRQSESHTPMVSRKEGLYDFSRWRRALCKDHALYGKRQVGRVLRSSERVRSRFNRIPRSAANLSDSRCSISLFLLAATSDTRRCQSSNEGSGRATPCPRSVPGAIGYSTSTPRRAAPHRRRNRKAVHTAQ